MKVLAIITLSMCFCMVLANQETLLKAASRVAKRSVAPRQTCDANYLQNYPSDCLQAFQSIDTSGQSTSIMIPPLLCEPRCGQPAANFYISCGLDFITEIFVALCGTNAMGQRCGTDTIQTTLNTTSTALVTDCFATISGSNCTTECRNALTSARMSSIGCCLNVLNASAAIGIVNPVYNRQLWEQSCGVTLPSPCNSTIRATITNGGVALVVGKVALAVALLLLGAIVF